MKTIQERKDLIQQEFDKNEAIKVKIKHQLESIHEKQLSLQAQYTLLEEMETEQSEITKIDPGSEIDSLS